MTDEEAFAELHETYANIGFLVCEFANFEGYLAPVLALMLNDNGDQASAILGQADSFAYRWGTVVGVAETLKGKSEVADAVLAVRDSVKSVNGFRNKLAHSGTRIHGHTLYLINNATTTKRGPVRDEAINSQTVQSHLDLIRRAMDDLEAVIDWSKLTGTEGLMRALRHRVGAANDDQ